MIGEVRTVDNVPQAFAAFVEETAPTSIALSGGGTARECYELLAVAGVEWEGVEVWFGDERWVPVHDPDSNEGMARRVVLLDGVEPRSIEPMYQPDLSPEAGAERYDGLLRAAPPLGLVHLGLGPDGHTCSLFPGSATLDERERFVVTAGDDQHPHPRLTITYPALARSELAVFTVAGEGKRDAFAKLLAGDEVLPAGRVRAKRVVWLVDRAANPSA